jgi:hypothetical protein
MALSVSGLAFAAAQRDRRAAGVWSSVAQPGAVFRCICRALDFSGDAFLGCRQERVPMRLETPHGCKASPRGGVGRTRKPDCDASAAAGGRAGPALSLPKDE